MSEYFPTFLGTRRRLTATGLVLALLFAGTAYAAWTFVVRSGATAKTGSLVTPTVAPAATPAADLLPGQQVQVQVDVTNPNSVALRLTGIGVLNLNPNGIVVDDPVACPPANFTVGYSSQTGLSVPVPAGGPTKISLPGQTVGLALDAPLGCMNRTVTLSNGSGAGWDLTFGP